jgi:hypothetical protein
VEGPGQADDGESALHIGLGPLGLGYILAAGGSGYFRMGAVRPHLESGRLRLVPGAPEFVHPAYAVHAGIGDAGLVRTALAGFRHVVATDQAEGVGDTAMGSSPAPLGQG